MSLPRFSGTILLIPLLTLTLFAVGCGPAYRTRVLESPETRHLKGWQKPYQVNGERYDPLLDHDGFVEEGLASWYGADFHGRPTSNGEIYDMHAMTAAHKTLPLGVYVRVHNRANGREAVVRVNDRGPFVRGRIIDLSYAAAQRLGVVGPGTAPVRVEALGYRVTAGEGFDYRPPTSYQAGPFAVQVGAFSLESNARGLAAELEARHGQASVEAGWVGGRLFHRVRVGRFDSLAAAQAARARLEAEGFGEGFVVALDGAGG